MEREDSNSTLEKLFNELMLACIHSTLQALDIERFC